MSKTQEFHWSPKNYQKYVERSDLPMLREYEEKEVEFVRGVTDPAKKTFIDVGAGYGRVLEDLADISRNVVAVELDENMFLQLEKRASSNPRVQVIHGDANQLVRLVEKSDIVNPVLVSLQNSIGPWIGDWRIGLAQMREIAEFRGGEVIISAFRQEDFAVYAVDMYSRFTKLLGEPDLEGCDFEKGIYVTDTGYKSRWWTKEEREEMKKILGGSIVREVTGKPYFMMHIKYS